jgi:penicillin-binding protein 1A
VITAPNAGMAAAAPYMVDVVRREAERQGVPVMNGGFRIYTTIDPVLQRAANEALVEGTARIEARPGWNHPTYIDHPKGSTDYLQGMIVALDPATGDVLALVGGRNYVESPFNRAVNAVRQPGSAFKPFVYAAAIADSIPPNAIVPDTAVTIPVDRNSVYQPRNDDGKFLGPITLREALTKSRNPVAVQLGLEVGIDSIAVLAKRLGIDTPIAPYPSSAIGATALRPIDLVAAYTVFDNLGSVVEPRFIKHVDDHAGRVVYSPPAQAPRFVMDPRVAFIVRDMMRDVVERGTATSVRKYVPDRIPVAGKTGTTNDNTDVWFVGMTPELVAGVWLGFDRPTPMAPGAVGGTFAAPIWGEMVGRWYQGRQTGSWEPPAGLVTMDLSRVTGLPADSTTTPEQRYTEYFLEGTEPGAVSPWSIFADGPVGF